MKEIVELKEIIKATTKEIYSAWLNSQLHTQMTGGEANCSDKVGASFTAWDGYISGKNLELFENKKIVQTWRTTEFSEDDEDSILTIQLSEIKEGTELTLTHKNIPKGQTQYKQGWIDHYFVPMKEFFK
ncbi:MAG TPA: ATPase [Flavobacteriales bacterium]|nr:ATPase [Flavobacteriales bacterium]